jgi:hypothetical protein
MARERARRVLIFILLLTGLAGKAQLVKRPIIIEPKFHTGIALPLYKAISYLVKDDLYAFDLSLSFPTCGKDFWEKMYRYPKPGIGYSYWSLGNNEILGKAHALYGYINAPIFNRAEKFSLNYQVSFGAAYLTKRFDKFENHLNRAIGSHLNAYVRFGIDSKIKLSPTCDLVIGAGGAHFSNGKTKSPNYGINAASLSLGVNYLFNKDAIKFQETEIPAIGKRYVQSVMYYAGMKVYDNLLGKRYFLSAGSYNLERILNQRRKIGLGVDFFYDGSIREALAGSDGLPVNDFAKLVKAGFHASYAIRYKQIMIGIQVGHYVYSKYTVFTSVYNRISIQYLFTNNMIGSIAIKSHMGKADCLEWGVGYTW